MEVIKYPCAPLPMMFPDPSQIAFSGACLMEYRWMDGTKDGNKINK